MRFCLVLDHAGPGPRIRASQLDTKDYHVITVYPNQPVPSPRVPARQAPPAPVPAPAPAPVASQQHPPAPPAGPVYRPSGLQNAAQRAHFLNEQQQRQAQAEQARRALFTGPQYANQQRANVGASPPVQRVGAPPAQRYPQQGNTSSYYNRPMYAPRRNVPMQGPPRVVPRPVAPQQMGGRPMARPVVPTRAPAPVPVRQPVPTRTAGTGNGVPPPPPAQRAAAVPQRAAVPVRTSLASRLSPEVLQAAMTAANASSSGNIPPAPPAPRPVSRTTSSATEGNSPAPTPKTSPMMTLQQRLKALQLKQNAAHTHEAKESMAMKVEQVEANRVAESASDAKSDVGSAMSGTVPC